MTSPAVSPRFLDNNSLTSEIFSILENNFLFGNTNTSSKPYDSLKNFNSTGKVRILSIDANDAVFAAKALVHLQSILRAKTGNPNAQIADFFDVVAGSGDGGILAALLFTPPNFTAEESLNFLKSRTITNKLSLFKSSKSKSLNKLFANCSLKDTIKPVLIPCYDLKTGAPFLFSRADALQMDGCDFKMADVCRATSAGRAVEIKSTDGRTKIVAVGGRVSMTNPTAAAITHVLNNKQEFPLCKGVEDLLVLSLGNCESNNKSRVGIAGDGAADMVDQAVSMAFGDWRTSNYFRIQGNGMLIGKNDDDESLVFGGKSVESVLFQGKKLGKKTNMEKLEILGGELVKEQQRRNDSVLPTVVLNLKHHYSSPARSSSATTSSSLSSC